MTGLRSVQRGLSDLGHDPGPIDGVWGPRTEAATRALLTSRGRPAAAPQGQWPSNAAPKDSRSWDEISLARLEGIHPDLRRVMDRVLHEAPFPVRVIDGIRTVARQKELVRIGASRTMRSRHLTGHAVDIVPLVDIDRDGRLETEELFNWPLIKKLAPVVKAAAKAEGVPIEWGGDWRTFPDGPHWQLPWKAYP